MVRSIQDGEAYTRTWGLGVWGALISGVISAGTAVYTTKLQVDAQEDIAKMQIKQQIAETAARKAEADAQKAMAEAAMKQAMTAEAAAAPPGAAAVLETKVAGIPLMTILLVGGGGLLLLMFLKKRK